MNVKVIAISVAAGLLIGLLSGVYIGYAVLCPSSDKAIVKQIKKDSKGLEKARIETKVKYVYRDKIKTVIKTIPVGECLDKPVADIVANGVRDAFKSKR